MSLIIKGLYMPKKSDLELFAEDNHIVLGGVCYQLELDQIIEIPTPHGRLIDESLASVNLFKEILRVFKEETTILESEE